MKIKKSRFLTDLPDDAAENIVGGAGGPPDFVNAWHGLGSGHQGGNDPGDTASQRHGFDQATAGKSEHNPTSGSNG